MNKDNAEMNGQSSDEFVSVTVRMKKEDAERFKKEAKKSKQTQGNYIKSLMDQAGNLQQTKMPQDNQKITLILKKKNKFCPEQDKETKKFECQGKVIFWPQFCYPAEIGAYKEELEDEFNIKNLDSSRYSLQHVLDLIYVQGDKGDKGGYLAYEMIGIIKDNDSMNPCLDVRRCKYVRDFDDVKNQFKKYAQEANLEQLEVLMSKTVKNTEEFEEYFKIC